MEFFELLRLERMLDESFEEAEVALCPLITGVWQIAKPLGPLR
jgi:hypothetical protein